MPTFGIDVSESTKKKANEVLDKYKRPEDRGKEAALLRIMELAESEIVKGTHPALEPALASVEGTISTLIKQINGIVSGMDSRFDELEMAYNTALRERDQANQQFMQMKKDLAETKKKAEEEVKIANANMKMAQEESKSAKALANEKSENNYLLLRQMKDMEAKANKYDELMSEIKQLTAEKTELDKSLATLQSRYDHDMDVEKTIHQKDLEKVAELQQQVQELKETQKALFELKDVHNQTVLEYEKKLVSQEKEMAAKQKELEAMYIARIQQLQAEAENR